MKDARYLVRIGHSKNYQPSDQGTLLARVRTLAGPLNGKAINLRVSPSAIEFDLFVAPDADIHTFMPSLHSLGEVVTCKRLDVPPAPIDAQAVVTEARHFFNEHRFWEVHEILEGLWKELKKGPEKELVQGLILAAAALVHVQKDEPKPVWSMLEDAMRRLSSQPADYYGWDVAKFRSFFQKVLNQKKIDFPTV